MSTQKSSRSTTTMLQKWIGKVEVKPRRGNDELGNVGGAFVQMIVLAKGPRDFAARAVRETDRLGLDVLEIEDIGLFAERVKKQDVHISLRKVARHVTTMSPVGFGTFHTYPRAQSRRRNTRRT